MLIKPWIYFNKKFLQTAPIHIPTSFANPKVSNTEIIFLSRYSIANTLTKDVKPCFVA